MISTIGAKIPSTSIGLGSINNIGTEVLKFDAHNTLYVRI
jgi:hypothetical protein